MSSLLSLLLVYLLGGLTFIPLLLAALFAHAYCTWPEVFQDPPAPSIRLPEDEDDGIFKTHDEKLVRRLANSVDVAAGYFLVTREFVPGGVNGKPPERASPAGSTTPTESPSVYQSMYRTLFDRKATPSNGSSTGSPKTRPKKAPNEFYVVLRHGHLMLYDDEEQAEVRHVISLSLYKVDIYGGGEVIPEGELYIRRNAIRLSRRPKSLLEMVIDDPAAHLPFYMFSEDCSVKEDFYLALVKHQEKDPENPSIPPRPLRYYQKDIISLVQRLHSSEEQLQMNWVNGLLGRMFLSVYRTREVEEFLRNKIAKKISRVNKPNFLSDITLQRIHVGDSVPYITNPRLKEMTAEGDFCCEADFTYSGGFRLEISTTATLNLGARFKPREATLVLTVALKKLEGHGLIRIKPPPSNRLWFSFEKMPKMDMVIEPIVGSRQVAWGPILRIIEGRIREVVAETIVLPYYDDTPFTDTINQMFRGGIWQEPRKQAPQHQTKIDDENEIVEEPIPVPETLILDKLDNIPPSPFTLDSAAPTMKTAEPSIYEEALESESASSGTASIKSVDRKGKRSHTMNAITPTAPSPSISTDAINVTAGRSSESQDATSAVMAIRTRASSSPLSPSPIGTSPGRAKTVNLKPDPADKEETPTQDIDTLWSGSRIERSSSISSSLGSSGGPVYGLGRAHTVGHALQDKTPTAIGTATAAVKKWYTNRKTPAMSIEEDSFHHQPRNLPPTDIPPPIPSGKKSTPPIEVPKRKNLPPPSLPSRKASRKVPAPPLPARDGGSSASELLVVKAPDGSEPTTPLETEHEGGFPMLDGDEGSSWERERTEVRSRVPWGGRSE